MEFYDVLCHRVNRVTLGQKARGVQNGICSDVQLRSQGLSWTLSLLGSSSPPVSQQSYQNISKMYLLPLSPLLSLSKL